LGKRRIVMEIGAGKKGYRQAIATAQKIKPEYSIIVSNDELEYSKENNAIKIPLKYFLLMR
jgi:tryptophan synthase beta subunit